MGAFWQLEDEYCLYDSLLWCDVAEGIVSAKYEDHVLMILTALKYPFILMEYCAYDGHFNGLWLWLSDTHAKRTAKSVCGRLLHQVLDRS